MNHIYYMLFDTSVSDQEKDLYMQFLSGERRQRVLKRKSSKAALECMLTGLFLRYGLEQTGNKNLYTQIRYTGNGKPYVEGNPVYFNLSHSGEYVILLIADQPCGIDIQKAVGDKEKLASRVMYPEEFKRFQEMDSSVDRAALLTQCWCAKEAYLKYTGEGIRYAMSELNTSDFTKTAPVYDMGNVAGQRSVQLNYLSGNMLQFRLFDEYFCTICMEKSFFLNFCKCITKKELFSHYYIK